MIVIFPMLVSKNVNTNLIQGLTIALEQYIAAYAISDFVGKEKEFNKYYNYKIKGGKIYQETDSNWFDLDPTTRHILEEQELLSEVLYGPDDKPLPPTGGIPPNRPASSSNPRAAGVKAARSYLKKKGVEIEKPAKAIGLGDDPTKQKDMFKNVEDMNKSIDKVLKDLKANKDTTERGKEKQIEKPGFKKVEVSSRLLNLEPTWVTVHRHDGGEARLGIKVIPMMIEGFNIKHTISLDMQKFFIQSFITGIGRKVMRLVYKLIDKWTFFGQRPRGDIRHDLFYARTGHNGQPFVLLDKYEDIPKLFFAQPQNMLKLWKMSWGNLLIADDIQKTVMFCMKKYKGMCTNLTYSMVYYQNKQMGQVFEDMEDARKAAGSLFKIKKNITTLGGKS